MQDKKINETLNKYDLSDKKYICCMNQFWKHKNHLTLLKAFDLFIKDNPNTATYLVLTGLLNDYRDMSYIKIVENYISKLSDHIKIVGFIPRDEQIVLMHKSDFIVQPSLFEGWGTVVEDAKVLDKTILLSDIPIHREQMNEKCRLFDPHNPGELAELIKDECHKEHHDDISLGIANMNNHALTYSKSFEQLLRDLEEK
jgi:glycosyltransferase involved in cell wall biosynthesis